MILADAVRKVRKMTSRKLNVSSSQIRGAVAAMLASCLICVFLLPDTLHALDPNVHVTQYMHTAFRTQDGSLAAGMYHIAQTSDGFLWFLSLPGDLYRFDEFESVLGNCRPRSRSIRLKISLLIAKVGCGCWDHTRSFD